MGKREREREVKRGRWSDGLSPTAKKVPKTTFDLRATAMKRKKKQNTTQKEKRKVFKVG